MESKTIIAVRHAHRDKSVGDTGISSRGRTQVEGLREFLKKWLIKNKKTGVAIASSPKRRCQETIAPVAKDLGISLETVEILDEGYGEPGKVEMFRAWCQDQAQSTVVVCSHGDFLPNAIAELTSMSIELRNAAVVVMSIDESGRWTVVLVEQEP